MPPRTPVREQEYPPRQARRARVLELRLRVGRPGLAIRNGEPYRNTTPTKTSRRGTRLGIARRLDTQAAEVHLGRYGHSHRSSAPPRTPPARMNSGVDIRAYSE
jgi:hypothetical protein